MDEIILDAEERMEKAVASLSKEFSKLRTGRASTSLVDELKVDYYGTPTPLNQMASVSVPDSRTITIQPWDKGAFGDIERALQKSDLGLNPVNDGKMLRIIIPPLTEDRRKDLVKVAKKHTEDAKVAIRNIRRDANDALKKVKDVSEDDIRKAQDQVQKLTDDKVAEADKLLQSKDKEIMEI